MRIGVIADDFTGASDVANTLSKAGARTVQHLGLPQRPAVADVDAAVVALKTRSIPAPDAVVQSLAACEWLAANGAEQILFKYCSTFDSTPQGNIGPVAEALLERTGAPSALICPAFPGAGRTVYQGHLFVHDRLLSESGMEKHPLNPMTDPDLRRWLARQTKLKVGHLDLATLRGGNGAAALAACEGRGERLIVADAVADEDLRLLGGLAAGHRLVTGGSGIALGLPANFGISPGARPAARLARAAGPALILSGSCSGATRRQVEAYGAGHPALRLEADEGLDAAEAVRSAWRFVEDHRSDAPLVYSTTDPETLGRLQARFGRERLAAHFEGIFARLAEMAMAEGYGRLVIAGGETSGAVAGVLGEAALQIGPEIAPGVPALMLLGEKPIALAFKSGNFGADDFFERALAVMDGGEA